MKLFSTACLFVSGALAAVSSTPDSEDFYRLESYPHALTKPFLDKYLSSRFYDYGGQTIIKSDSYIRLTGDRPDESGWLFSKLPAMPENFQIEFEFKIHGGGGGSLSGDGLAMWITTHKGGSGPVFGTKDRFEGLGIFFDTYKNNRPGKVFPIVMAMNGDGKTNYDHAHDGLSNEIASCSAKGLVNANGIARARVTHVKGKFFSVDLDYRQTGKWQNCFMLEQDQFTVPEGAFLGFSARTGQLHENHEIHRVQVYSLRNPPSNYGQLLEIDDGIRPTRDDKRNAQMRRNIDSYNKAQSLKEPSKSSRSWWGLLGKLLLVILAVLIAFVGYGIWLTKNKQRRRRTRDYYL